MKILTLDDFDLKGKTVFVRMDMNCPIDPETNEILGTKRIEESIETLEIIKRFQSSDSITSRKSRK